MGLNKKIILLAGTTSGLATVAFILYNLYKSLDNIDFNDPFEVELDDE